MKILWIVNTKLPEVSKLLNQSPLPFGGWLIDVSKRLSAEENMELFVAFPENKTNNIYQIHGEKIIYYSFPKITLKNYKNYKKIRLIEDLIKNVNPDLVHIFGTEYPHALLFAQLAKKLNIKTIVTIQGLVSSLPKHYLTTIPPNVQKKFTFRDFIKKNNLILQKKDYEIRGHLEEQTIKIVDYIIGRTEWDKACISHINPNSKYFHNNENLRDSFYSNTWNINNIDRNTIFMSQGSYPVKGLHIMIDALAMIVKRIPNVKLYISGMDIRREDSWLEKLKITTYGKYINKKIKSYNLEKNILFTGLLSEVEMQNILLKTNVFVIPSTIENSPNSLGEAMILGVPTVASYVGGIPSLILHNKEGLLYQHDASYMLSYYVMKILNDDNLALKLSKNAKVKAQETHNREKNFTDLLDIYKEVKNC